MPNLNIIGNGFDLYHGLPSSYYYFACYILSENKNLYDYLTEMYGFNKGVIHYFTEELERGIDDVGYWSEFEKNLGYLSSQWVEDSLVDDLGLEYPDAIDLQVDLPNRSFEIKEMLMDWIKNTVDTKLNFATVRKMIGTNKMKFSDKDMFISFNYTHTLEEIYKIQNVLHIHGESNSSNYDDLIVGHGNDRIIKNLGDSIYELDMDDYDQPSRNRKTEYQFEKMILEELRKPVEKCREKLSAFINEMTAPDNIFVYGFSLGDVDIPYLQLIHNKWPECRWHFSYFSESDKTNILQAVKILRIDDTQYDMFEFKNQDSYIIKEALVEANKIHLFPTINELLEK